MPLSVGDKLGSNEILARIGAGGMGEVHRARGTRLGREVASRTYSEMGGLVKCPVWRASQAERPRSRITLRGAT
jgi:hypothetical protein